MANQTTVHPDHEDILALLPWYVNNSLDDQQRQTVSNHIEQCQTCKQEIEFLSSLGQAVQRRADEDYASKADAARDFSSVMNRIDATGQKPQHQTESSSGRVLDKWLNILSDLTIPQWGATAMAGLLVAVVGFNLFVSQPQDDYSVLSSSDINDNTMRLSIQLTQTADSDELQTVIRNNVIPADQSFTMEKLSASEHILVLENKVGVDELNDLIGQLVALDGIDSAMLVP